MGIQPSSPAFGPQISPDVAAPEPLPIGPPFVSTESALEGMRALEQTLRSKHDRRAIFLTAYVVITREISRRIEQGFFQDSRWTARYLVSFANLYRQALADFESGNFTAVPKAWLTSFNISKSGMGLLMQDLLCGINAHINHDLALALDQVSIDPNRVVRYQDHTAVNQVLSAASAQLKQQVESLYAPGLELWDKALSPWDSAIANFSVDKARENAWESAVALANSQNDQERASVMSCLDDRSAVLAQLLTIPTIEHPTLVPLLRHLEQSLPWWERILVPQDPNPSLAPH